MGRGQGVRDSPELLDGEAIPRAPEEPHAGESAPGGVVGAGAGDERGREVGGAGAGARSGGSLTTVRGPPRCRRRRGDASHPRRRMISGRGDRRAGGLAFCLFLASFFILFFSRLLVLFSSLLGSAFALSFSALGWLLVRPSRHLPRWRRVEQRQVGNGGVQGVIGSKRI